MKNYFVIAHEKIEASNVQSFLLETLDGPYGDSDSKYTVLTADHDTLKAIKAAQKNILAAEKLVLQFPLYWYSAPWQMKRWQDAIFTDEFTYELQQANRYQQRKLQVVVSIGAKRREFQAGTQIGRTLSEILSPYEAFAKKLGFIYRPAFVIERFSYMSEAQQQMLLIDYLQRVVYDHQHFAERGRWLLAQLEKLSGDQVAEEALKSYLEGQLDQYETLEQTIKELKNE